MQLGLEIVQLGLEIVQLGLEIVQLGLEIVKQLQTQQRNASKVIGLITISITAC